MTSVTYDATTKIFTVVSHSTLDDSRHIDYFDSVVCCNGHFSVPNWVPPLKGLADFKGRVIHAHSFRDALCGNQAVRRVRVDGVEDNAMIQHERAVKF